MTQPMVPIRDGPTTGQRVEILWDVPAVWSMAAVDEYHPESGHHSVTCELAACAKIHTGTRVHPAHMPVP